MRLIQGEVIVVTWLDGQEQGWAFGSVLEDPSQEGYFPQAVLEARKSPHRRQVNDTCSAVEKFDAPTDIGGYLNVEASDKLRVLHPPTDNCVWVFVELLGRGTAPRGWVPESVLGEPRRVEH